MAERSRSEVEAEELSLEQVKRRLDNLDQRLDSIDTMVTALAERMLKRPLNVTITCPNCGRSIELSMVGSEKMTR